MTLLDTIADAWGWTGLQPQAVVDCNAFGNLIVRDTDDRYWRICPEELSCDRVAEDADAYAGLAADADFAQDWAMAALRDVAIRVVGPLTEGRCYCLRIPAALGGDYAASNLASISVEELVAFAGDVARQIEHLPDGATVRLQITD